jgi:predicted kinase
LRWTTAGWAGQYAAVVPTLLLIGGTHGAGKTTLGDLLASRLNWVLVSRDRVRGGMAWTEGEEHHVPAGDLSQRAVTAFYKSVAALIAHGASVIAESGFRRGISEVDLLPFGSLAQMRLVQCHVPRPVAIDRCRDRHGREFVGEMLESRDEQRWARIEQPLDLSIPVLTVSTTDGYEPGLEAIEAFARAEGA